MCVCVCTCVQKCVCVCTGLYDAYVRTYYSKHMYITVYMTLCRCVLIAGSSAVVNTCMFHVLAFQALLSLSLQPIQDMVTFSTSPHARAVVTIYYICTYIVMYIMHTATVGRVCAANTSKLP